MDKGGKRGKECPGPTRGIYISLQTFWTPIIPFCLPDTLQTQQAKIVNAKHWKDWRVTTEDKTYWTSMYKKSGSISEMVQDRTAATTDH